MPRVLCATMRDGAGLAHRAVLPALLGLLLWTAPAFGGEPRSRSGPAAGGQATSGPHRYPPGHYRGGYRYPPGFPYYTYAPRSPDDWLGTRYGWRYDRPWRDDEFLPGDGPWFTPESPVEELDGWPPGPVLAPDFDPPWNSALYGPRNFPPYAAPFYGLPYGPRPLWQPWLPPGYGYWPTWWGVSPWIGSGYPPWRLMPVGPVPAVPMPPERVQRVAPGQRVYGAWLDEVGR